MKTPKLRPAVFLEAARIIGEGDETFACCAIATAVTGVSSGDEHLNGYHSPEHDYFQAMLRPKGTDRSFPWYSEEPPDCKDVQTARILGLCLCAILAKEGFQP